MGVLGIEAGQKTIYVELWNLITGSDGNVNPRHLQLLSETMCLYGDMRPATRHGIGKGKYGPLMKASYEQTVDVFFESAAFSSIDYIRDMSSSIIVGRPSRAGTGVIDVYIQEEMLPVQNQDEYQIGKDVLLSQPSPISMVSPTYNNVSMNDLQSLEYNSYYTSPIQAEGLSSLSPLMSDSIPLQSPIQPLASPRNQNMLSPLLSPRGPMTGYYNSLPSPSGDRAYRGNALYSPFDVGSNSPNIAMHSPAMNSPAMVQSSYIYSPGPNAQTPSPYGSFSGNRSARSNIPSPYSGTSPRSPYQYAIASPGASPSREDVTRNRSFSPEDSTSVLSPNSPVRYDPNTSY